MAACAAPRRIFTVRVPGGQTKKSFPTAGRFGKTAGFALAQQLQQSRPDSRSNTHPSAMCEKGKTQTIQEILAYLAEHPDAQDTLEGIAEWWLLERRIVQCTGEVREALDDLVAQDLLLERKGKDERSHYRINPRRPKEIASLIKRKAD